MAITWISIYAVLWIVKFSLFGMQRTALLISRSACRPYQGVGKLLLPTWYPLTWLVIIGNWCVLFAMAIYWNWIIALVLAIVGFVLSVTTPIPYSLYEIYFRHRAKKMVGHDPETATILFDLLDNRNIPVL